MTRKEFGQYVNSEYGKLLGFVRSRLSNPDDAEDLVQQTLLKLLLVCDEIDAKRPSAYFFTALKTALIDYWRRQGRRPATSELPEQLAGPSAADGLADPDGAEEQCRLAVRMATKTLTEREFQAFTAYWKALGDRGEALEALHLAEQGKQESYRVYDGPLCYAKRKLREALLPHRDLLRDVGHHRVWEIVIDVLSGISPEAAGST
jgi:RNA polymerase sigma factor (sigma-70 family)